MAAFSFQHPQPFLLDTVFFPNTPTKISEITVEGNINGFTCFSQPHSLQEIPADFRIHESSCLDHSSRVVLVDDEPSVTRKLSTDSSSMVDNKLENDEQVTQKVSPMEKKRKNGEGSSSTTTTSTAQSKDLREGKCKKKRNCFNEKNDEEQNQSKAEKKERRTVTEEAPKGYIHVRARRGQATDNHSLAERVRREKISERMKILQSLVPGCDKVTGKALMLDEIINYVQSLQNQVEFLSMKLASLNPMFYDFGMDLDALMARPETVNTLVPALPPMQQCSPALPTTFIDSASIILSPSNNYSLLDHSTALLLQEVEEQRLNGIPQDNGDLVWHLDEQRQQYINQDGFNSLH